MSATERVAHWAENPIWKFVIQVLTALLVAAALGFFGWMREVEKEQGRIADVVLQNNFKAHNRDRLLQRQIEETERDVGTHAETLRVVTERLLKTDTTLARQEERLANVAVSQTRIENLLEELVRLQQRGTER